MRRLLPRVFGSFAAALALSGCIKLDSDMKIAKDDTFSGSVIVALNAKAFESLGMKKSELKKQMNDSLKTSPLPTGIKGATKVYEKGDWIGTEAKIESAALSLLPKLLSSAGSTASAVGGSGENTLKVTHVNGKFVVSGEMDLSSSSGSREGTGKKGTPTTQSIEPDLSALMAGFKPEIRIKLTFPGKVLSGSGKIDGKSITWSPEMGKKTPLKAEAKDS